MLEYTSTFLFMLFGGMAVGCALSMIVQRNPLYSAISLVGVFVSLACLYVTLAAPFIAAVQVIVYAGAIMVLVVFVIMLLNVETEVRRPLRLRYLIPVAAGLSFVLIAQVFFMLFFVGPVSSAPSNVGLTASIGAGLFTEYILPFEITSVLILMAIVGAMTLARRAADIPLAARSADSSGAAGSSFTAQISDSRISGSRPGLTEIAGREMAARAIERLESRTADRGEGEER